MAKFTFADGTVFEGTAAELAEYTRLAGGAEAEQSKEIEGPVRVGDTIEITEVATYALKYGGLYEVVRVDDSGVPYVSGDRVNEFGLTHSKYRIVARKAEAPEPAKPLPKVGDYVVFDKDGNDTKAGRPYRVEEIDSDGDFRITDDVGDDNHFDTSEGYRIITDARELAFAKAGRKLDEFKAGDIARSPGGRVIEVTNIKRGTTFSVRFDEVGIGDNGFTPESLELIATADARVDSE